MKYTCNIEVKRSKEDCVKLWLDESYYARWQDGFQYKEWKYGRPNATGSISNILFAQGKRKIELEETILENNLPDFILGEYVHVHMINSQKISFQSISETTTLITSEVDYKAFYSFLPKMMAKLFPGMFKKQSQKWLDQFKRMAETSG